MLINSLRIVYVAPSRKSYDVPCAVRARRAWFGPWVALRIAGRVRLGGCDNSMKKIVAVLQPSKFEAVKQALMDIGVDGMTASETRGYGRQKGHKEVFRGREYTVDLLPKIKLEIVIPAARLEEVVEALAKAARTGRIGDGKIFVYEIDEAIRIRNEERGEAAL
jgi:nitrogen regulatory protein P-II 1